MSRAASEDMVEPDPDDEHVSIVDDSGEGPGGAASGPLARGLRIVIGALLLGLASFLSICTIRSVLLDIAREDADRPPPPADCAGEASALRRELAEQLARELVLDPSLGARDPLARWQAATAPWLRRARALEGCAGEAEHARALRELQHALELTIYSFHAQHDGVLERIESLPP